MCAGWPGRSPPRVPIAYGTDHLAPRDGRKELRLVLLGAVPHDHRCHRRNSQIWPGYTPVLEFAHQQVLVDGAEAQTAVFGGPVHPEPPLVTDLAPEGCHLPTGKLEVMDRQLGAKGRCDVLVEEVAHFGQPGLLRIVQLEIHEHLP